MKINVLVNAKTDFSIYLIFAGHAIFNVRLAKVIVILAYHVLLNLYYIKKDVEQVVKTGFIIHQGNVLDVQILANLV